MFIVYSITLLTQTHKPTENIKHFYNNKPLGLVEVIVNIFNKK